MHQKQIASIGLSTTVDGVGVDEASGKSRHVGAAGRLVPSTEIVKALGDKEWVHYSSRELRAEGDLG